MASDYQPGETVMTELAKVTLVAVIGPTAVGKTTLINAAAVRCPALHPVLTTTSRQPRHGEENGIDIHFCSREEMEKRIAEKAYVQVASDVLDDLYATSPEDYTPEGVAVMAILADAMPTFMSLPFKAVHPIFILPPSWDVWKARIDDHAFTAEQYETRMVEAGQSLRYAIDTPDLVFVVNDDLAQSTLEFTQAALGAAPITNQFTSRDLAAKLLKELQNR